MDTICSYNAATSSSALDMVTGLDPQAKDNPDSNSRPGNTGLRRLPTVAAAMLIGLVATPNFTWGQDMFVAMSNGEQFNARKVLPNDFCFDGETCVVGDVDGDRKADIIAFEHGRQGLFGVYVSLSKSTSAGISAGTSAGANFAAREKTDNGHDFCFAGEHCAVGDVDGDGKADLIVFQHTPTSPSMVYVGLSQGTKLVGGVKIAQFAPPELWLKQDFCFADEHCAVGDVDGDRAADIIVFQHGPPRGTGVYVALSDRTKFVQKSVQKSNDYFCLRPEWCEVGDANRDGKADIIVFQHGHAGTRDLAGVFVGLSEVSWTLFPSYKELVQFGSGFGGVKWADHFCFSNEWCAVGDVDGDRAADIIVFQRGGAGNGVFVGLSEVWLVRWKPFYEEFRRFARPFKKWHGDFCTRHTGYDKDHGGYEYYDRCAVGDVNGDGLTDVLAFNHGWPPSM